MLVYVISSPNLPNTVYVGSTEKTWKVRWSTHTSPSNSCMSKGIVAAGGASMDVIETVTDPSVNLVDREFFYIMHFKEEGYTVFNERMPGAIARAGGVSAYGKKYRADNPERTRAANAITNKKNLLPLMCDCCGRMSSQMNMKAHQRTKRCKSASQVQLPMTITNNITATTVNIYNK
jgi:hypothetical protein